MTKDLMIDPARETLFKVANTVQCPYSVLDTLEGLDVNYLIFPFFINFVWYEK